MKYFLNGEEINVETFITVNEFSEEEIEKIRQLQAGEKLLFGGGAAPVYELSAQAEGTQE